MSMSGAEGDLLIVGGGRMGEALVSGLLQAGWPIPRLVVVENDEERRTALAGTGVTLAASVGDAFAQIAGPASGVGAVVAVKPGDVRPVCEELRRAGAGRVLSIAAGVTLASLEGWLGDTAVVRAMPNTPALVGSGAAAVAAGRTAGRADLDWARRILGSVGTVVELSEPALDAVTGLSGSGPAYVFLVVEALIDAGVLVGLARPVARELAIQTVLGSARLLAETGDEPATLRAAVTSPGGTTAAGVRALEAGGVRSALIDAVVAATERARQLGAPS